MKKQMHVWLAGVLSAAMVTSCAGSGNTSSQDADAGTSTNNQPVTIRVAVEKSYVDYFTEAGKAFKQQKGDHYTVEVTEAGMFDVLDALPTQKGNAADVFMMPNDRVGNLSEQRLIKDIEIPVKEYLDNAATAIQYDGKVYMLPLSIETTLLIYNKDLVSEQPKTLKELSADEFAAKFTDFYYTAGMFYSHGGYIFKDGNIQEIGLNNEGSVAAGKSIQGLYQSDNATWKLIKDDTIAHDTMMDAFYKGSLKYIINGPWSLSDITAAGIDAGAMPIPSWDGSYPYQPLVGTKGAAVNAYSAVGTQAEEFLAFMANKEWAGKWHDMTLEVSPHQEVAYPDDSIYQTVFDAASLGQTMPNNPEFGYVWEPMADALRQIAAGEDSKAALDSAVDKIQAQIAEAQ